MPKVISSQPFQIGDTVQYASPGEPVKTGSVIRLDVDYAIVDFGDGKATPIYYCHLTKVAGLNILQGDELDAVLEQKAHDLQVYEQALAKEAEVLKRERDEMLAKKARDDERRADREYPGWKASGYQTEDEYSFVNAPKHYNDHPSGVECQVIIRECKDPMISFAMKHLWRSQWGAKPGQSIDQDLAKAIEYIQLEQARRAGKARL